MRLHNSKQDEGTLYAKWAVSAQWQRHHRQGNKSSQAMHYRLSSIYFSQFSSEPQKVGHPTLCGCLYSSIAYSGSVSFCQSCVSYYFCLLPTNYFQVASCPGTKPWGATTLLIITISDIITGIMLLMRFSNVSCRSTIEHNASK